jgi:predicted permease
VARNDHSAAMGDPMGFFLVLEKIGVIFLMILIGYVFSRIVRPAESARKTLSSLVLNISVPASILSSVDTVELDAVKGDMLALAAISAVISLATLALSFPLARLLEPKDRMRRAVTQAAIFFHNYGFLGWPVCYMLLGETGLLYAVLFSMPLHLLAYGLTPLLLSRAGQNSRLFDKTMLVNLPFYATLVALALMIGHVRLPAFAAELLDMLGSTQTPLAMIIVGMILATVRPADMMSGLRVYGASAIRLGLFPVLAFFALRALGFSGLLLSVPVLITAMPTGTMTVVLAQRAGMDAAYASRLVVVSTLLSLVTIPLVSLLAV